MNFIFRWWRWLAPKKSLSLPMSVEDVSVPERVMPFDANLLDRARTYWQYGDWRSLATMSDEQISPHPSRSALKVFKASGLLQSSIDRHSVSQARDALGSSLVEGGNRQLVLRTLVAGVHNNLAIASLLSGRGAQSVLSHLIESHVVGRPGGDARLTVESSLRNQIRGLSAITSHSVMSALEIKLAEQWSIRVDSKAVTTHASRGAKGSIAELNLSIDGIFVKLGFFSHTPKLFRVENTKLHFELAQGSHIYLLTSESGSFDSPPRENFFSLQSGKSYELFGTLEGSFSEPVQVWAFQYSASKKLQAKSTRCTGGQFHMVFHADPFSTKGGIGIRLSGSGYLELATTALFVNSNSAAALGLSVEQQVNGLKKELISALDKQQAKQARQSLAQLESFVRLQTYMGRDLLLPDMHGWPISPDFGVLAIRLLEAAQYDLVIEFGSGSSTVIIAEVLHRRAQKSRSKTRFISFEHLEMFRDKTRELLRESGRDREVELTLATLTDCTVDGETYAYYDESILSRSIKGTRAELAFVLVDGPPGATGPLARFPAFAMLAKYLPGCELHFLMDDYAREDEREIVDRWHTRAQGAGYRVEKIDYPDLEKQACLLKMALA